MFFEASATAPNAPIIPTQISASMACAYVLFLLQKLKSVPWVTTQTARINAIVRLVLSGIATLGVTIAWQGDAHQLVVGNLYASTILMGLWHWFTQYATAHGFEKLLNVASPTPTK